MRRIKNWTNFDIFAPLEMERLNSKIGKCSPINGKRLKCHTAHGASLVKLKHKAEPVLTWLSQPSEQWAARPWPCRLSWSCRSGRVWCAVCQALSWWRRGAAVLRRCSHDWWAGRSTASPAEGWWWASASASHPPPRSVRYRIGSTRNRHTLSSFNVIAGARDPKPSEQSLLAES